MTTKDRIKTLILIVFALGCIAMLVNSCQRDDDCRAAGGEVVTTQVHRTLVVKCVIPAR